MAKQFRIFNLLYQLRDLYAIHIGPTQWKRVAPRQIHSIFSLRWNFNNFFFWNNITSILALDTCTEVTVNKRLNPEVVRNMPNGELGSRKHSINVVVFNPKLVQEIQSHCNPVLVIINYCKIVMSSPLRTRFKSRSMQN